jgi:hypothetical protein
MEEGVADESPDTWSHAGGGCAGAFTGIPDYGGGTTTTVTYVYPSAVAFGDGIFAGAGRRATYKQQCSLLGCYNVDGPLSPRAVAGVSDSSFRELSLEALDEDCRLTDITYGNNRFVAVGRPEESCSSCGEAQIWLYEPYHPGRGWQDCGMDLPGIALNGVAYGNGRFVAVGDMGTVLWSVDGSSGNWTALELPGCAADLNSITFGSTHFVAVGDDGEVWLSANGETGTWTDSSISGGGNLQKVVFGNGTFVAGGDHMWLSHDGSPGTWAESRPLPSPHMSMSSLVFGEGRFLVLAPTGAETTTWWSLTCEPGSWENVYLCFVSSLSPSVLAHGADGFIALSRLRYDLVSGFAAAAHWSADGLPGTWFAVDPFTKIESGENRLRFLR